MLLFQFDQSRNWNQVQINLTELTPIYGNLLETNILICCNKKILIQLFVCHIIAVPLTNSVKSELKQVNVIICREILNCFHYISCVTISQRWCEENNWLLHHRWHWARGQWNHTDWFSKDWRWQSYPARLRYCHHPYSCQWPCSWLSGLPPSITISHS